MTVPFLDLYSQYISIRKEIDAAVSSVICESAFIGGRRVKEFEEHFAAYQQTPFCVGVGNGTDALEIALEALELPPGSEVLVPANTFIATSEAVTRAGHRVVFCDCDPFTYTISVTDAEKRITKRTAAIMAVHLYGQSCDMDPLMVLAGRHSLRVIEDCAQAHGAEYKGARVGGIGHIGTFSFYPGKNLGAYGDGGAIVTSDGKLAERCRMIANHGRIEKYNHRFEGRNSRLDGLQAAILDVKLNHLDIWTGRRRSIARLYGERLRGISSVILPVEAGWSKHVWHLHVIRTGARDDLKEYLARLGIQTAVHYPIALPKLEAYAWRAQHDETMFANRVDGELLSLPMGEHLRDDQIDRVAEAVRSFDFSAYPEPTLPVSQ